MHAVTADLQPPPEPAGFVVVTPPDGPDLQAVVDRYGCAFRLPVAADETSARLRPGAPCFLFRTDRSRVVGIWAIGEVVADRLDLPAGAPPLAGEAGLLAPGGEAVARSYAEVELLPLEKPISADALRNDRVLGEHALGAGDPAPGLLALTSAEVRALGRFDFWLVDPSDEQRAALDAVLDAEG